MDARWESRCGRARRRGGFRWSMRAASRRKAARVRAELPDAFYCAWDGRDQNRCGRPCGTRRPTRYSRPRTWNVIRDAALPVKLGLKKGLEVSLLGAPDEFEEQLGEFPEGAKLSTRLTRSTGLALWFVRSRRELESETRVPRRRVCRKAARFGSCASQAERPLQGGLQSERRPRGGAGQRSGGFQGLLGGCRLERFEIREEECKIEVGVRPSSPGRAQESSPWRKPLGAKGASASTPIVPAHHRLSRAFSETL
jgi:hypothetical protein